MNGDGPVNRFVWHCISGEQLLEVMRRCATGENPDAVYAEFVGDEDVAVTLPDCGVDWRARAAALAEALLRIYRTPVYKERGNPLSGISVAMTGAIYEGADLARAALSAGSGGRETGG